MLIQLRSSENKMCENGIFRIELTLKTNSELHIEGTMMCPISTLFFVF